MNQKVHSQDQTPSIGLRRPSLEEGAGKRCSECESASELRPHSSDQAGRYLIFNTKVLSD